MWHGVCLLVFWLQTEVDFSIFFILDFIDRQLVRCQLWLFIVWVVLKLWGYYFVGITSINTCVCWSLPWRLFGTFQALLVEQVDFNKTDIVNELFDIFLFWSSILKKYISNIFDAKDVRSLIVKECHGRNTFSPSILSSPYQNKDIMTKMSYYKLFD